jgi:putative ABC transport system substrate-binding protein
MKRRKFIGLLSSAAAAWPIAALGQQQAMPVIGFMSARAAGDSVELIAAFQRGLSEGGFVEHRNVAVEYRWAGGNYELMPTLAAELVDRRVAVLLGVGGDASALAAKKATTTIPVIFGTGSDPVAIGLVQSINRPGGNVTGVHVLTNQMEPKRLGLLDELVQRTTLIGVLINHRFPASSRMLGEIEEAARIIGRPIFVAKAGNDMEMDAAFAALVEQRVGALLVAADPYFDTRRGRIVAFAAGQRMPAMYQFREYAVEGGLVSYGVSITEAYRTFGTYAARILKGEKPADLPVQLVAKTELVINLKAARGLGFEFPPTFSARADEVIE